VAGPGLRGLRPASDIALGLGVELWGTGVDEGLVCGAGLGGKPLGLEEAVETDEAVLDVFLC